MFFSISASAAIDRFLEPLNDSSDILFRNVLDASYDSILITDADLGSPKIVYANPAFCRMTGYSLDEVIGQTPKILQGPKTDSDTTSKLRQALEAGESYEAYAINYRKDGTAFHLQWRTSPVFDDDGSVCYYMAIQRDVTDEINLIERLREKAEIDSLTGLLERGEGEQDLRLMLESTDHQDDELCLIMLDIDHFKAINDNHGHVAGDHVIRRVAQIIDGRTRGDDLAIRWGGEEFVCVLRSTPLSGAIKVAESIRGAIAEESMENIESVTISAGVALHRPGESMIELIDRVDKKLYTAKEAGRNRVEY